MCSAPKPPKIQPTPPPPPPANPAASRDQTAPQSPERQRDMQIAKRMGASSLRINLKRSAGKPNGPSLNIPRK